MTIKEPQATFEVNLPPAKVLELLPDMLSARGYLIVDEHPEDAGRTDLAEVVCFGVKRSAFRNALIGLVQVKQSGEGAVGNVYLSRAPGEPYAVMDKKRNKKTAVEIAEYLRAGLSG